MTRRKNKKGIVMIIVIAIITSIIIRYNSSAKENIITIDTRKYYYNQLTKGEKQIYDKIKESKQNIMNNEELPIAKIQPQDDENQYSTIAKMITKVIFAYRMDNPMASLWFNNYCASINTNNIIIIRPKDGSYYEFESREELEDAIEEVEQITEKFVRQLTGTNEEKIKEIHDWLLKDLEYDESLEQLNIANIYGCIIKKKAVCTGFSYSFKYVADMAQLPIMVEVGSTGIASQEDINHMWNVAFIEDTWYRIDLVRNLSRKKKDKFFKFLLENSGYYPSLKFKSP